MDTPRDRPAPEARAPRDTDAPSPKSGGYRAPSPEVLQRLLGPDPEERRRVASAFVPDPAQRRLAAAQALLAADRELSEAIGREMSNARSARRDAPEPTPQARQTELLSRIELTHLPREAPRSARRLFDELEHYLEMTEGTTSGG